MNAKLIFCIFAVVLCSIVQETSAQYYGYASAYGYPSYYGGYGYEGYGTYGTYGAYGYGSPYASYYGKRAAGFENKN